VPTILIFRTYFANVTAGALLDPYTPEGSVSARFVPGLNSYVAIFKV
jgi:hypothetical protein